MVARDADTADAERAVCAAVIAAARGRSLSSECERSCPVEFRCFVVDFDATARFIHHHRSPMPNASPYLLLFRNAGPDVHQHLSPTQRQQLTQKWNDWYDGLAARGKVAHGRPLELTGRVVSGPRGERVIDGPYAEAKEVVGGYFFLTVADLDEATAIAQQCPGLPLGLTVEVRPVAHVSPVLEGVPGRPPTTDTNS